MGDGTRVAQMENRFGLGQPVDTYGEPCPHVKAATQVKETVKALDNKDINEAQAQILWKQAIKEAVQDSNLKALAGAVGDMGDLKSYYEDGEPNLVLKGRTGKPTEGYNNIRVALPHNLIETIMAEEGPVQVELTNPISKETYSFYKDFHRVEEPDIDMPTKVVGDFQVHQDVIVKMRGLPIWEFVNQVEGKASGIVKFNNDGILVANLGGKEIPIESIDYDYLQSRGISGTAYVEFEIKDISKTERFRLYDNGFGEPRFTIEMGDHFRQVVGFEYDPKRDVLKIEYERGIDWNSRTSLRFMEPPDKIDFDTRRIPEEMRLRWEAAVESENKDEMGQIGEEVGANIAEEEYNVKVSLNDKTTGPDGRFTRDSEPCVLEVKSTADKSKLGTYLEDAKDDVQGRNKAGIAVSVYIDKDTGSFEYKHDFISKTQDKGEEC